MNYKDTMTYQVNYVKYKEAIKRWLEIYHKKEVKKVKIPYFEMKVVKVREEKDFWCGGMKIDGKQYKVFKRKKGVPYLKEFDKGNWVNGENLDKVKFPCFCSYKQSNYIRCKGIILTDNEGYDLHYVNRQISPIITKVARRDSIKKLIEDFDIHILKGKIIIFEEEEEK